MDEPPVDALDLADLMKLKIRYVPGLSSSVCGHVIKLGAEIPPRRLHYAVAHECAHHILDALDEENTERNACYLGAALLVPGRALLRQIRRNIDFEGLRCIHVNASAELLARRIVDVKREGSVAFYDKGRFRYRFGLDQHARESEMAQEAHATGCVVRADAYGTAWPIFVDGWRRVIVLAASAQ